MAFGDLLEQVGSTGRFQVLHVTLLCIPVLMMASHNLLQNFVAAVPSHYCSAHTNLSQSQLSPEETLLITVPLDKSGRPQRCQRYVVPQWHLLAKNGTSGPGEPVDTTDVLDVDLQGCTDGWSYATTEMSSTIVSEWHLVCDLRSLKQMGQTVYMGGVLVGALVFGGLSDRYGRRILLLISNLLMAVSGTCAAFSTSFPLYCLFRFGCGMALSGQGLNTFSLIVEWIPTRVRTVVGTITGYCYTVGQLILAVIAYFIRDWRWLTLAVSLPFYVFFLFSWWFHESSRWLALNNKSDQAIKNLKSVAKFNGRREEGEKIDIKMLQESMKKEMSCTQGTYSVLDLFRKPTMRTITVCLSAVWYISCSYCGKKKFHKHFLSAIYDIAMITCMFFILRLSTSFAYYGLSMDLQKFGVDIYLIQVIFGAVDIPAKVVITVSMSFIGRRPSQCGALIVAGITILINLLVPYDKQTIRTCLAVVGKGCLAASFNCCYLYSGELYPTIIRQNGMGWVSMMARVGAMVAPMVLLIGDYIPWLPGLIFGAAPILSGVAAIFLPETLGSPLPDTIQDVEDRGSGRTSKMSPKETIILQDTQANFIKQAA
ncbi:solute carrier family 22 member 6 isoform X1 [Xiphias gladius]|uniref:solute carrier family 22 member 6 isoform X1 n=1 Tax=Xiphias gladius TaxID=8245 RepID=UPI001A98FAB0|nr:solute carrier family 22 member 6 isoform X1 [Xiphias gladius]XP_040005638.1 solute carrier family 22 member 6 isoform X1 [Xiphias gladius]XP_040005639.1 solute carrier family 22 member 6 isoform X1 [Xiphias gladius]XP_040005640.1 solute carrier family 22 member 6 isoform X1 [Xiphias gladius]